MYDKLTKSDIKKMEEEIEYRVLTVRKEAIEAVKVARAQGDLSENFEYYAAKRDKNKNESRINYLEKMIKTAQIIDDDNEEGVVSINNTVELFFENMSITKKFKIVTTVRASATEGLISIDSPVGKAVLGKKLGERVYVDMGKANGYYVVIKSIDETSSDSEDTIRSF